MNPKFAKVAAGLVLFVSGAVVGFFGSRLIGDRGPLHLLHGDPRHFADMILQRLSGELDLTEAQRDKLRPMLQETAGKIDAIRKEQEPKIRAIIDKSKEDTKALLTPEQRVKFTAIMERLEARRKAMERFGPPPPPPGFGPPPGPGGHPPPPPPGFGPPDFDGPPPPPPDGFGPPPDLFGPELGPPHGKPHGPAAKEPAQPTPDKPATDHPAQAPEGKPQ